MGKLAMAMVVFACLLLIPYTVIASQTAQTQEDAERVPNSVRITIGGERVEPVGGAFMVGDVVFRDSVAEGEECSNPSIGIGGKADVRKVKVGPRIGSCDYVIKTLEFGPAFPDHPGDGPDALLDVFDGFDPLDMPTPMTTAGYQWELNILAKIVGVLSIDDLTKTNAGFRFKTSSFTYSGSLFDGGNQDAWCWAHYESPFWWYVVDDCDIASDLSSTSHMYVDTDGEYDHTVVPSFAHSVNAEATVDGNTSMPSAMGHSCTEVSKPTGSDLECEFTWSYLGYN